MNEHTIYSMMGAVNHWWAEWLPSSSEPMDEVPFWVSNLIEEVQELMNETFDFETGEWSGDS